MAKVIFKSYNPTIICFFLRVLAIIFRSKRLAGKFDKIFTQIVLLLAEENLVTLKVQYIDGTKIESVANKYTFVWKESTVICNMQFPHFWQS